MVHREQWPRRSGSFIARGKMIKKHVPSSKTSSSPDCEGWDASLGQRLMVEGPKLGGVIWAGDV